MRINRHDFQQLIVGTAAICTNTWPPVDLNALFVYSSLLTRPAFSTWLQWYFPASAVMRLAHSRKNKFINNNVLPMFCNNSSHRSGSIVNV